MICGGLQSQRERQLARLKRFQAHARIDVFLENGSRILRRDLLDFHSARRRRHEHRPGLGAINHDSQIKFFLDRQSFFDQQPPHHAAFGPGLMRHQRHAQDFARQLGGFLDRLGDLHAAALAAPAGMDLGLDHNARGAGVEKLLGCGFRRFRGLGHFSARHRDAILLQDSLAWYS